MSTQQTNPEDEVTLGGVSLRDYFAAQVMTECIRVADAQTPPQKRGDPPRLSKLFDKAATYSYYLADAMLKARQE